MTTTTENLLSAMSDTAAAVEAGRLLAEHKLLGGVPAVVLPPDYRVEMHPELLPTPARTRRTVRMQEPKSFCAYVNRYAKEDTAVFWDSRCGEFLAVIDYDSPTRPAWGEHRVEFQLRYTPEWDAWHGADGMRMSQEDFALFVEQNAEEIVSPDAATMLKITGTLQATNSVVFHSGARLDNGTIELRYEDQIDGRAGQQGTLEIPQIIRLGMRVHCGGCTYVIEARFRYRINSGRLTLWYDLIRPHKTAEASAEDIALIISEQLADIQMYEGNIGRYCAA